MKNITRLHLHKNPLANADHSLLSSLNHLELLNLHSTEVNKIVFDVVKQLPALKKLCLWNTALTNNKIKAQQELFPNTELIGGLE